MLDSRRVARNEAGTGYRDDDEYGYVATDVNEDGGGCKGDIHDACARSALSVGSEFGRTGAGTAGQQTARTHCEP